MQVYEGFPQATPAPLAYPHRPHPQAGAWTYWSRRKMPRCEPGCKPASAACSARRCRWARRPGTSMGLLCSPTTLTGWSPRMAATMPCCCAVPRCTMLAKSPLLPAMPWPLHGSRCWVGGSGRLVQVMGRALLLQSWKLPGASPWPPSWLAQGMQCPLAPADSLGL